MTENTLYLLVTCSMERSRAELADRVVSNLIEQNADHNFFDDLLVFDNGSTFHQHLDLLPPNVTALRCEENYGYWSAIAWVLDNFPAVMGRDYKFIYIIESDLIHYDMYRIGDAENFLENNTDVGGVRTQHFSVRWRSFFDKRYRFLPLARRESWVMQTNQVTGAKVRFELADRPSRIYKCNFLAKLPALNRIVAMRAVFSELRMQESIVESDFMRLYHKMYPVYAVLDGGIFRMMSSAASGHVSGSYSTPEALARLKYRPTRTDRISTDKISPVPLHTR